MKAARSQAHPAQRAPWVRWLRWAVMGLLGLAYTVLSYVGSAADRPPFVAMLAGFAPLAVIAAVSAWHSRWRWPLLVLLAGALAGVGGRLTWLRDHAAWLFFLQHAGAMALLAIAFGATLGGHTADALCSRIALRVVPQQVDADYVRYTWRVTLAWAAFFATMAVASVAVFWAGSSESWAFFATVATPVLVLAMFGAEYAIRLRALPGRSHLNVWQTMQAYRQQRPNAR